MPSVDQMLRDIFIEKRCGLEVFLIREMPDDVASKTKNQKTENVRLRPDEFTKFLDPSHSEDQYRYKSDLNGPSTGTPM